MRLFIRIAIAVLVVSALSAAASYAFFWDLKRWGSRPLPLAQPVIVEFPRGTPLAALIEQLRAKRVILRPVYFRLFVRFFSDYSRFQAGTYRFKGAVSPARIAQRMTEGKIYQPVVAKFTIPEGYTYQQISARLVELNIGSSSDYEALFTDRSLLAQFQLPGPTLEGYLYPATYLFTKMPSAREALATMLSNFRRQLPQDYEQRIAALGLTLQQAVTFASLIELETPQAEEKPLISEVIWRRLRAGMPLGIDAALIYGIADYRGNLSAKHLKDAANPYNTRLHKGLPPTPIGSPAQDSFTAVTNPADLGNYYFVVDADNPRFHLFAKSFQEHSRNVRKLVQAVKQRNGRLIPLPAQ